MDNYISKIPSHTLASIERYVNDGCPTGDFLHGMLTNDLAKAMWHADEQNLDAMRYIFMYIYNRIPMTCWGSKEKVAAWYAERREKGPLDKVARQIALVP